MKLTFYGAAEEVTGSCFLLESGSPAKDKILIDCGLFQGGHKFCDDRNREKFPFDPAGIEALFITHAHLDHTGRIPKLVKDGFMGKIYSSLPTKDLGELMLSDSLGVMTKEASREKEEVFYSEEDVSRAIGMWEGKNYMEKIAAGSFTVTLYNAGHILGSSMLLVEEGATKALFTGDLGNPSNPLIEVKETPLGPQFLVAESTYGDTDHEGEAERRLKLERVIEKSVGRGGVLMIPAFSLERTQQLLWEISGMLKEKQIPEIPIFLDSPLAIKATKIYQKYYDTHLKKAFGQTGSFSFFSVPDVKFTLTTEESKEINNVSAPKIIIAGSGMSTGGRILHHERRYLKDSRNTILFVGYQAPGTLGRRIRDGAKTVTLFGDEVPVNCHIEEINGYSAHPDKEDLFNFVQGKADTLKKVFLVHGEPRSSFNLVQTIRDYMGIEAYAPKYGESVEL
ncbi:MBL fold metallo-hydrolase [Candidatus Giovannonibacteria bacterium]|nr:MBL fold metallo-hydrolase [Candidatus Giovannonibacteria bacterium]